MLDRILTQIWNETFYLLFTQLLKFDIKGFITSVKEMTPVIRTMKVIHIWRFFHRRFSVCHHELFSPWSDTHN